MSGRHSRNLWGPVDGRGAYNKEQIVCQYTGETANVLQEFITCIPPPPMPGSWKSD